MLLALESSRDLVDIVKKRNFTDKKFEEIIYLDINQMELYVISSVSSKAAQNLTEYANIQ